MFPENNVMMFLQLGTGFFWILTYVLIIKRGFQDRTYGMPMAAICANISWEFIFSFIYRYNELQAVINMIWFSLDAVILMQYLLFGGKDFKKYLPLKYFLPSFVLTLVLSFLIILAASYEFQDFEGKYAAFSQNLMMSVLFVSLFFRRGNLSGQSISIGVFKMIGSLLPAVAFILYFPSPLITMLAVATFIFDLIYILLMSRMSKLSRGQLH
ncbi:hypothetical protein [Candidatus Formimonas warabiya]|uniref:PQ-loop repeat-containing protein n=1 Tax=Formimonas warabiya TaxID=1761012 RepID=A0A3G1KW44_FORW1|nr:hypothetical protein [Candidatus Formimonas warabiya]ATW26651.1 hypothetical protein DCMF_19520 [Candidatus Formimonas warabiya]